MSGHRLAAAMCTTLVGGCGMWTAPTDGPSCPMPEAALGSFVRVEGGSFVRGAEPVYPQGNRI